MMEAEWLNLANAVIILAADDYRRSRRRIRKLTDEIEALEKRMKALLAEARGMPDGPEKTKMRRRAVSMEDRAANASKQIRQETAVMKAVEKFFRSTWADTLARMDASAILRRLKEEKDDDHEDAGEEPI